MTDWNKLKVVDLKAALKKRGLPLTGLKPALVARLDEAESQDGSESEATIQDDDKNDASSAASPDTISTTLLPSGLSTEVLPDEPSAPISEPVPNPSAQIETAGVSTPEIQHESPAQVEPADGDNMQEAIAPIAQNEPISPQPQDIIPPSQPSDQPDAHTSALPSVAPQEVIEDSLKRKRRSDSPPVTSTDAARKRLRPEDELEDDAQRVTTTQDDAKWVENHNATDAAVINGYVMEVESTESVSVLPGPTIVDTAKEEFLVAPASVPEQNDVDLLDQGETHTEATNTSLEDVSKNRDSRFTNLFTKASQSKPVEPPSDDMENETDRIISPARHPATSALYIKNFMRPLNAGLLQPHLAALATPPGQETDPDILVNFFLDPIKTHAFVIFTNTSAASRVRNAFHDRIWPDEKTRKPLWVDFVPVEKAEEWIAEEMASNTGGRGQGGKKWEVVYEEDPDRYVTATLQEVSASSRPINPMRQPIGPGQNQPPVAPRNFPQPPLGPRGFAHQPPKAAANVARLDQLFNSTTAKPVLYFKPVSKQLVDRRLDAIDAALSKDAAAGRTIAGDSNRYTFEDGDILVDRGREIFSGIRPPQRGGGGRGGGRGGGGGRYRSRGGYGGGEDRGGYDRRYDSYRGERRDSRDDRRY